MDPGNITFTCVLSVLILHCHGFLIEERDSNSVYSIHPDTDCRGNDAWGGFYFTSLTQCQQFCDDKPECVAFAYMDTDAQHSCWPKNICDELTANYLGWTIYKKDPVSTSSCGFHATFDAVPGYSLYGYNNEVLVDTSEPACARRCMMKGDQCMSFDFNNCTNTCYLSAESRDTVVTFGRNRHMTYYHKKCTGSDGDDGVSPDVDTDGGDDNGDVDPGISGSGNGDIDPDGTGTSNSTEVEEGEIDGCRFLTDPGHALFGHNNHVFRDLNLQLCMEFCKEDQLCLSFDFSVTTGSCFISYSSKFTDPHDFGPHSTLTYYHKMCNLTQPTGEEEEGSSDDDTEEGSSDGNEMLGSGHSGGDDEDTDDTTDPDQVCLQKMGYFGGDKGSHFSDRNIFMKNHGRISQIRINHKTYVDCIGFTYGRGDDAIVGPCHGGTGGIEVVVDLDMDEYIIEVNGQAGSLIDRLTIVTNWRHLGPYGGSGGTAFSASAGGSELAFITGRSGSLVDQLNLHFIC